jgi:hypothetical protein
MSGEASKAPRRIDPVEPTRLVHLARACRHREPGPCPCCPSWCRRHQREVSMSDRIGCLKDGLWPNPNRSWNGLKTGGTPALSRSRRLISGGYVAKPVLWRRPEPSPVPWPKPNTDTGGEFVPAVGDSGLPPRRGPSLSRLRPIDGPREFATSVSVGFGPLGQGGSDDRGERLRRDGDPVGRQHRVAPRSRQ